MKMNYLICSHIFIYWNEQEYILSFLSFFFQLLTISQRNQEKIELRIVDEKLKLNEIAIGMKTLPLVERTLENRFENSSQHLKEQKQKLMKEVGCFTFNFELLLEKNVDSFYCHNNSC